MTTPANDAVHMDRLRRAQAEIDLVRDRDGWSGGRAYDPKAGRSYRARIRSAADGGLEVTGCLFLICRTRHWSRTKEKRR